MLYYKLRDIKPKAERARVIDNLVALREQLDADIPNKDSDRNLLLATWNIRDLAKSNRRGFGARTPESLFYIAEVLSRFDFVAVQEVNELGEWERIMGILGREYDYIATDVPHRMLGSNGERLTFLYDRRKVSFQNIAGEVVLPPDMLISQAEFEVRGNKVVAGKQFRRTPFFAKFQSGWFKFDICTVHLYYGNDSGEKLQERVEEIGRVAEYLSDRADSSLKNGRALILLGDFNIVKPGHKTMQALLDQGFVVPKSLNRPSNIDRTKFYDQIAFKTKPHVLEYVDRESRLPKNRNSGIFEIFDSIYTEEQFEQHEPAVKKSSNAKNKTGEALRKYYKTWRTYQFSDHKPMWVRLGTDDSERYLIDLKDQP